ncbi:hypothetical protein C8034_v002166 [Colletotrichum sidae]|uniref:BTB domain-containing protein n=1 Tax=Colletotrichum sidae TaxID=1347389 RepID=A0A4R8TVA2_9PEZI|nr:hypothetical protein C8034_v002166 [Colletotrichum sidae]
MEDDIITMAADGDIIMNVGPHPSKKFRVHSSILKAASKVFSAMLGPNFAEGQQLLVDGRQDPATIKLPEDDSMAMEAIFNILHHHINHLPEPKEIVYYEIAIAANKYDLAPHIRYIMLGTMTDFVNDFDKIKHNMETRQVWQLAMASAYFGHAHAFKVFTKWLVINTSDDLSIFTHTNNLNQVLALKTCIYIEVQRKECRQLVFDKIMEVCSTTDGERRTLTFDLRETEEDNWDTSRFFAASIQDLLFYVEASVTYCGNTLGCDMQDELDAYNLVHPVEELAGLNLAGLRD